MIDYYPNKGQCGKNVYYEYDRSTATLTISGEGAMYTPEELRIETLNSVFVMNSILKEFRSKET